MAAEASQAVYKAIKPHILETPIIRSSFFSQKYGKNIYFKLECLQKTGSFKARGAAAKVQDVIEKLNNKKPKGLVTASGGNHGLGVCAAAQTFNVPAHVFISTAVSEYKKKAIESLGGTAHVHGDNWDDSNKKAMEFAAQDPELIYIHPFDDAMIILGQGSVAVEIFEQLKNLKQNADSNESNLLMRQNDVPANIDALICSVGGGGLISGISQYTKAVQPNTKVFGVQTHGANSMYKSIKQNEVVMLDSIQSICEGLGARKVAQRTFETTRQYVDGLYLVSDKQAMDSLREVLQHEKLLVEPSCSCSVAALDQIIEQHPNLQNIMVVLCGSNFPIEKLNYLSN